MSSDTKPADFIRTQREFVAHVRDPEHCAAPNDIEDRRIAIYRQLVYNNIEDFIANGFPVLRKLYNDTHWHAMIRGFIIHHRSTSPYFLEISQEFLQYLEHEHTPQDYDPKFLLELAHYEWVELALSVAEDTADINNIDPNGDLFAQQPVLSPLAWPLQYQWPVHQIGPNYQPQQAPATPTQLIVFRDRKDNIRFVTINPLTMVLLNLLQQDSSLNGETALTQIAAAMPDMDKNTVIQGGLTALQQLQSQGIILGVKR